MTNDSTRVCKYSVAQLRKGVTKFRRRINRLPVDGYLELHATSKDVRAMMESASGKRLSFKGFMHGVGLMSNKEKRALKSQIQKWMHGSGVGQMSRDDLGEYIFDVASTLKVDWDPIFASLQERKRLPRGCRTEPRPGHGKAYRPPAQRPKRAMSKYNHFVKNTLMDPGFKRRHQSASATQRMREVAKLWQKEKTGAADKQHAAAVHREDMLAQANAERRKYPAGRPRIPKKKRPQRRHVLD